MADEALATGEFLGVAAEHATDRVPIAAPDQRVGEVRDGLVGGRFESVDDVAVLVDDALVGLLPVERLLAAPAEELVSEVMDADPPVVAPGADQEVVAWRMVRRGESSMGVVDAEGRFVGLIAPKAMLEVLLSEHDEDMARLGGYVAGASRAREAAEEPVSRRIAHRLPWLLVGLLGALGSAVLVGFFEQQLKEVVLLAFFLPGVLYMAAAIGTQTQAVLIRGLAVELDMGRMLRRELVSGAVMSAVLGLAFFPFALLGWGDADVALGVSLALFASALMATLVAIALPLLFRRFGADPAFGSGPLATVMQDLLSVVIYLAIAAPIAT